MTEKNVIHKISIDIEQDNHHDKLASLSLEELKQMKRKYNLDKKRLIPTIRSKRINDDLKALIVDTVHQLEKRIELVNYHIMNLESVRKLTKVKSRVTSEEKIYSLVQEIREVLDIKS